MSRPADTRAYWCACTQTGRGPDDQPVNKGECSKTGRKCYLDVPSGLAPGEEVTFVLNLHGGGSVGHWQREYFPACDYVDTYRLAVATPSAATTEPTRHWAADADDEYLVDLVESVLRLGRSSSRPG